MQEPAKVRSRWTRRGDALKRRSAINLGWLERGLTAVFGTSEVEAADGTKYERGLGGALMVVGGRGVRGKKAVKANRRARARNHKAKMLREAAQRRRDVILADMPF